jgi:hypothetical protein
MKKAKLSLVLAIISIALLSFGCYATQQPYNLDQPGPLPTSTPAAAALYVGAIVQTGAGITASTVVLASGSSVGTPVTGAVVTINGETIPDTGSGIYLLATMATAINAGAAVTLNITSSAGNASASGTFPASPGGMTTITAVTGAAAGSSMILMNP